MRNSNVIVVTINYRLGALGYMALNSIYNETNGKTTGGMNGINDQIVALQWIQDHISDYGGNPDRVTVFGESAGGFSCCFLSITPKAAGLLDQIIIQSGHCSLQMGDPYSIEYGLSQSQLILSNLGLPDDLDILRAENVSTFNQQSIIWPSVDGYIFKTIKTLLNNNKFHTRRAFIFFTHIQKRYHFTTTISFTFYS